MAYVVDKGSGRWEIRESMQTPSGPRARTLATFRVLSDEVMARAAGTATRPFDRNAVREAAWRAGVPTEATTADGAARTLLAEAAAGRLPAPVLRRLLVDQLSRAGLADLASGDSGSEWAGASAEERGRALWDLLELTDRLPARRRGALRCPRLRARADG